MAPHQRKKVSISILIPFLIFILFFTIMIWQKYRSSHDVQVTPPRQSAEANRPVTLFFAADGTRLAREAREIAPCEDDVVCLKSTLDELLNGPVGEFDETEPEGATINAVRIEGNQATVEFNNAFSEAMPSGSSAEMMAVYAVVNTVCVNFPRIQKVKINVDGKANVILSHLDLTEPLMPDYSLEQPLQPASEKNPAGSTTKGKGETP